MLIPALALLYVASIVCVGALSSLFTDRRWVAHADVASGKVICAGRAYWVVDANDPEACCLLQEMLRLEQEQRESADAHRRTREGAGLS